MSHPTFIRVMDYIQRPSSITGVILCVSCVSQLICLADAKNYQCEILKDEDECVFRDVVFNAKTSIISFSSPPDATTPSKVAFESSNMSHLPPPFLEHFEAFLTELRVGNSQLQTITITSRMKALYAKDNHIRKVILHQDGQNNVLETLDLSGNQLESVQNITRCQRLKVLNLSSNQRLVRNNVLDLSIFGSLDDLQELYLADNGGVYLDNTVELKSLESLDLSRNSWASSDMDLTKLSTFSSLHTLMFNDNNMETMPYAELLELKSLKTVHLNGNGFTCCYLRTMIQFLQEKQITTPTNRTKSCQPNQKEVDGMCCQTETVWPIVIPTPPTQSEGTFKHDVSTDAGSAEDTPTVPEVTDDGNATIGRIITVAAIFGGVICFIVLRRKRLGAQHRSQEDINMAEPFA